MNNLKYEKRAKNNTKANETSCCFSLSVFAHDEILLCFNGIFLRYFSQFPRVCNSSFGFGVLLSMCGVQALPTYFNVKFFSSKNYLNLALSVDNLYIIYFPALETHCVCYVS